MGYSFIDLKDWYTIIKEMTITKIVNISPISFINNEK